VLIAEALRAYREAGTMTQTGFALAELAALAQENGAVETAARLAGMVDAIVVQTGAAFELASGITWAMAQPAHRRAAEAARADGQAVLFPEALAEAIAIADALTSGNPSPGMARHVVHRPPGRLSTRERHVLSLLAQRYTAPEIADQLFLSVRTVERHVSNIYNKLGVNSRRAAVAAATQYGLV
jgi:DNA-binding NarL/FixJ family response regulator